MIIVTAIDKFRDEKGRVIGYILKDSSGVTMNVTNDNIKEAVKNRRIRIPNLRITKNNRLVYINHAPKKLTEYTDRLSKLTGIERTEAVIDGTTAQYMFKGTTFTLQCALDENNVYLSNGKGNMKLVKDITLLTTIAKSLREIYKVPKQNSHELVLNTLDMAGIHVSGINTSELPAYINTEEFEHTDARSIIKIKDTNLNLIIHVNSSIERQIVLSNCELKSLTIKNEWDSMEDINILDCVIPDIRVEKTKYSDLRYCNARGHCTKLILNSSIVENELHVENTPIQLSHCFINTINAHDITNLDLNTMIVNEVNVVNNYEKLTKALQHTNKLYIYAEGSVTKNLSIQTELKEQQIEFITLKSILERVNLETEGKIYLDVLGREYSSDMHSIFGAGLDFIDNVLNGKVTWSCGKEMTKLAHANGYSDYKTWAQSFNINKNAQVDVRRFCTESTINVSVNRIMQVSSRYNTHILKNNKDSIIFNSISGLYVASNTNIVVKDIVINGTEVEGLLVNTNIAHDVDITITGDIKYMYSNGITYRYLDSKLLDQLRDITKIGTIHVYYNTPICRRLMQSGIEVDILDKDQIPRSTVAQTAKAKLIGTSYWDILSKNITDAITNHDNPIECNMIYKSTKSVSDTVLSLYNILNVREYEELDTTSYAMLSTINLIKQLPVAKNLFTKSSIAKLSKLKNNNAIGISSARIARYEGVAIYEITILERNFGNKDKYWIVLNGRNIVYATYAGNLKLLNPNKSNPYLDKIVQEFQKWDYIDIDDMDIGQTVTMSAMTDTGLYSTLNALFNFSFTMVLDSESKVGIVNTGNSKVTALKYRNAKSLSNNFGYIKLLNDKDSKDEIRRMINRIRDEYSKSMTNKWAS